MASFQKLAVFPVGYFRAASRWLLENRKDVAKRLLVIDAEVSRIGHVRVRYQGVVGEDGSVSRTENRIGFSVTPGSTLEKLIRAYIIQGGNPYDISPFKHPDTHEVLGKDPSGKPILIHQYPEGGLVAPLSADPTSPEGLPGKTGFEAFTGGFLNTSRYYPARMGGRISRGAWDSVSIVRSMDAMRAWANQEIKERLQDLEWRIIKQCDLREQLLHERDDLLFQSFAGSLNGLPPLDAQRVNRGLLVSNIIADMTQLICHNEEGTVAYRANGTTPLLYFTFPDVVSEQREPLGG